MYEKETYMDHKKFTMRNALLVFCITSVVFALLLQTFLFHQTLRRQIRAESISDHEISLNKMQTDIASFVHNVRTEMLTIYSEQDLISDLRSAAEEGTSLKELVFCQKAFYERRSASCPVSVRYTGQSCQRLPI